eukprot:GHVT01005187.1.p1 GENE.GHVT01005187.1~~GHVT01005187.1.p1  ORF type:complete len:348 (-),score=99.98 GHVT01005187.1:24-1067(-)
MTHANEELKALTEAVATWAAAPGQHQQEEPNELEIQAEPIKGAEEEEKEERGKEGGKRRRSVTQGGMEKENTRRLSSVWENFKTENDDEPLPCSCSSQGSSPCSPSISSSSSSSSSSNSSSSSASGCAAASVCWCESPGRCSSFLREPPLAVPSCRQSQSENSSPARGCAAGGARRFHFSQCCLCCWDSYCSASSLVFEASCLYTLARCYHHLDIVDWAARLYLAALAALQQAQTIAQTHTADLKLDLPLPLTHNDELQTQTQVSSSKALDRTCWPPLRTRLLLSVDARQLRMCASYNLALLWKARGALAQARRAFKSSIVWDDMKAARTQRVETLNEASCTRRTAE